MEQPAKSTPKTETNEPSTSQNQQSPSRQTQRSKKETHLVWTKHNGLKGRRRREGVGRASTKRDKIGTNTKGTRRNVQLLGNSTS